MWVKLIRAITKAWQKTKRGSIMQNTMLIMNRRNKRGNCWAKTAITAPSIRVKGTKLWKWTGLHKGLTLSNTSGVSLNAKLWGEASSLHAGHPFANALASEWQQMRRKRSQVPVTWPYNVSWNPQQWGERRLHTDSKIIYLSRQNLIHYSRRLPFFHSPHGYCIFAE